jgi:hypothetical protein
MEKPMKRTVGIIAIIVTVVCIFGLAGCEKEPYGIKFEREVIDFGRVEGGTNVDVVFKFKNTGRETIEIKLVRPTCGCTAPGDWDQSVEPGKTGKIPVTYNTEIFEGEVAKIIYVDTNVPGRESITLVVQGIIVNPVIIPVKTCWLGKTTNENEPLHGSYLIKYFLDTPMEVADIILPDENTTATMVTVEKLKKYRLDFTVNPPFEKYDLVKRNIILKIGGKAKKEFILTYSYQVPPPVEVNPKIVRLDMEKLKEESIERRINIKSNIEKPIEITDLKFDGAGVDYSVTALREDMFIQIPLVFPLGFTFPEDKKTFYLSFRVKNDPRELLYIITIMADDIKEKILEM